MKQYLLFFAVCFIVQSGFGQEHSHKTLLSKSNLIGKPSCEVSHHRENNHHTSAWQYMKGTRTSFSQPYVFTPTDDNFCFDAASFGIRDAGASEGDYFFGDSGPYAQSKITQTVDLGADRGGENFFYSYQYRLAGSSVPNQSADIVIEYLNSNNEVVGRLHEITNFRPRVASRAYIIKSGANTAPSGTEKIKWTILWSDDGRTNNKIILDDFWLSFNNPERQCIIGLHGSPYACFTDPKMLSGDVVEMTCEQFYNEDYINSLIMIDPVKACDVDGDIKVRRPRGNKGGSEEFVELDFTKQLIFEYKSSSESVCQQAPLILNVRVTGDCPPPSISNDFRRVVIVPMEYDLDEDPNNIIAPPQAVGTLDYIDEQKEGFVQRTWIAKTVEGSDQTAVASQFFRFAALTVYQETDYKGSLMSFSGDRGTIWKREMTNDSDTRYFDNIRSIKIAPGYQVTIQYLDYGGNPLMPYKTFPEDVPDITNTGDGITSFNILNLTITKIND